MSSNPSAPETSVLVVGAGPTGLMMAAELARRGIQCRIIDKNAEPTRLSKALGIHARTLEIFENIGIADRFVAAGIKARGGSIYAGGKRIVHFLLDRIESRYNYALMLPQSDSEALLNSHLESFGTKVERSVELTGIAQDADAITAMLRMADGSEQRCRAQYVVGCDGAHSTLRHAIGVPFVGAEYEETFVLADIHADSTLPDDEISGFASENGLVFFFPITRGRFRVIADVPEPSSEQPTLDEVQKIIDKNCHMPIRLHDPEWMSYFRIHRRQATSYRVGRAFLAGDSAHIHSPAGGQGMNTGIQDAYNLGWKLALFLKGLLKPAVLDSYAPERHAVGRQVLKATDAMTRVLELRNPIAIAIRDRIVSALASTEFFSAMARGGMSELDVNYRESPIVAEYHEGLFGSIAALGSGPRAGDRAPDAGGLRLADGKETRMHELIRGDAHKLFLLVPQASGSHDAPDLLSLAARVAEKYRDTVTTYLVGNGGGPAPGGWSGPYVTDPSGELHRAYHAVASCAYLVRPDGYVSYRSFPPDPARLLEFLGKIFV